MKYGIKSSEVEALREKYGSNKISEKEQETFLQKYIGAFNDPIIKILIVALILNTVFVFLGQAHWYESVGIALAIMLATFVSTFSEYKNEKAFKALQEEANKTFCKVYRDGEITQINIDDIVSKDCILLQTGDKVPVDGVIIKGNCKVDQSTLNGESEEVEKQSITDSSDLSLHKGLNSPTALFRGTLITDGEVIIRATEVGDNSMFGQLAQELQEEDDRETPLKVKLNKLAHQISVMGYVAGILTFFLYMIMKISHVGIGSYFSSGLGPIGKDIINSIMSACTLIICCVPEGLPMSIALAISVNSKKMLKDNILVKNNGGIETAGSLNILFSDKTGTITKGKLEVVKVITGDGKEYSHFMDLPENIQTLIQNNIVLNSSVTINDDGTYLGGNSTERALFAFLDGNLEKEEDIIEISKVPFSSDKKYSAIKIGKDKEDNSIVLVKGAPEKILEKCKFYCDKNGETIRMIKKERYTTIINDLASQSMRVLALATAVTSDKGEDIEIKDLKLTGFVAIRDDVRPEAIEAIEECKKAGIQVVMITGDNKETAVAIAKDAGLIKSTCGDNLLGKEVYTSDELAEMTDEDLKKKLENIRVIARALPSDKSRLVKIAQDKNLVVGMTGDGKHICPTL